MDKLVILAIIAKNGLDTAEVAFTVKVSQIRKASEAESDPAKKRKMIVAYNKLMKISKVVRAAHVGLDEYLKEPIE